MLYPEYAEVNGQRYKLNTDVETAKECFRISDDPSISDYERPLAIIYKLFGFVPTENLDLFLAKAVKFLQCGKEAVNEADADEEPKDMDINYDEGFIAASFMSDYKIDLNTANLHYWQFMDLLQGLSEECILSRVRKIRSYDLSEISDARERTKMARVKDALKLPETITAEEQKAIDDFERLFETEGVS